MRRAAAACAALALAACTVGPDYSRPDVTLPEHYPEASTAADGNLVPPEWWRLYGDPLLDELVGATLTGNADLARLNDPDLPLQHATLKSTLVIRESSRR